MNTAHPTVTDADVLAALGPLAPLYRDATIQEIMVDAYDRVYVEREEGAMQDMPAPFASPDALRTVIDAVLALGGIALTPEAPVSDLRFPDGARFLALIPPVAIRGPCLILRRRPAYGLTWDDLFRFRAVTREAYDLLQGAIRAGVNLLIAGGPGAGKTTVISRIAESIPAGQRLVVVEEMLELQVAHPRVVRLVADRPAQTTFEDLVFTGSCMRPDWLIVGELVGPEALRVLRIFGHGHRGMTTIHATSPENALARLEALCLMGNIGLGLGEIRALIASAVGLITYQEKLRDGRRRILQIVELRGVERDRYVLQPLMRYDAASDALAPTSVRLSWEQGPS